MEGQQDLRMEENRRLKYAAYCLKAKSEIKLHVNQFGKHLSYKCNILYAHA